MKTEILDLDEKRIKQHEVVHRLSSNEQQEAVIYVVPSSEFSLRSVKHALKEILVNHPLLKGYVLLHSMPITQSGEVDVVALSQLPVINRDLIVKWQEYCRDQRSIEESVVLVAPEIQSEPPYHLQEIIPEELLPEDFFPGECLSGQNSIDVKRSQPCSSLQQKNNALLSKSSILQGGELIMPNGSPSNLVAMLESSVEMWPNKKIWYRDEQMANPRQSQTYSELWIEARTLLAHLQQHDCRPGQNVVLQLKTNRDFITAFWGCVLGGLVPVSSSVADNVEHPDSIDRLVKLGKQADATFVISSVKIHSLLKTPLESHNLKVICIDDALRTKTPITSANLKYPDAESPAVLLATSGSTGLPKLVIQSHRNLVEFCRSTTQMMSLDTEDVAFNWMPIDHVGGLVYLHLRPLYQGSLQLQVATRDMLADPLEWLTIIDEQGVTYTWAPNFWFGALNAVLTKTTKHWDLSRLRYLTNAGETIARDTLKRFVDITSAHGLKASTIHPAWGMAETCSGTLLTVNFSMDRLEDNTVGVGVGKPIPGGRVRIVDAQRQIVPQGVSGDMEIAGTGVTPGYYGNSVATGEALAGDGWLRTGDIAVIEKDEVTIVGRNKDVIIINGKNYGCQDIESAVEALPGVVHSYTAAISVRVGKGEEATEKVVLFFCPQSLDPDFLCQLTSRARKACQRVVGTFPHHVIPIAANDIPKTGIGKIQRPKLKQRFLAGDFNEALRHIDVLESNTNTLPRWFYTPILQRKVARIHDDLAPMPEHSKILVFLDEAGLGLQFCSSLNIQNWIGVQRGSEYQQAGPNVYTIHQNNAGDYECLLEATMSKGWTKIDHILHLWLYDELPDAEVAFKIAQERGIFSLRHLLHSLSTKPRLATTRDSQLSLSIVSSKAQLHAHGALAAEKSTIVGFCKTLQMEWAHWSCRHIDFDGEMAIGRDCHHLQIEWQNRSSDSDITYRQDQRHVVALKSVDITKEPKAKTGLRQGGTYVVSGGLGGIGFEVARWLLHTYQAHLILVGRTSLDKDIARHQRYQKVTKLPGKVTYVCVDIADGVKLKQSISFVCKEWNTVLDGVIHLAGEFEQDDNVDKLQAHRLSNESVENFQKQFSSKVHGTQNLYRLVADNSEALFVAFSSVLSFFSAPSVGAYSAANSYLEAYLQDLKEGKPTVVCLAWSMWLNTGMSAGLPDFIPRTLARRGLKVIDKKQGIDSLIAVLDRDLPLLHIGLNGRHPIIARHFLREIHLCERLHVCYTRVEAARGAEISTTDDKPLFTATIRDNFCLPSSVITHELVEWPSLSVSDYEGVELLESFLCPEKQLVTDEAQLSDTELQTFVAWKTELCKEITNITGCEEVSADVSLTSLGIDSVKSIQLLHWLKRSSGHPVGVAVLHEHGTIKHMSLWLAKQNITLDEDEEIIEGVL